MVQESKAVGLELSVLQSKAAFPRRLILAIVYIEPFEYKTWEFVLSVATPGAVLPNQGE